MAFTLLPEPLWTRIEPLLPPVKAAGTPGRPAVPNRQALTGILFVLHTGCPWQMIPKELGCGSGSTCWRRLEDWTAQGVWPKVHALLLTDLGKAGAIDLSRAVIDSASVRALKGGTTPAPTPRIGPNPAANAMS